MLYFNFFSPVPWLTFFPMKIESKAESPGIMVIPCKLSCFISAKFSTVSHQLKNFSFTFRKKKKTPQILELKKKDLKMCPDNRNKEQKVDSELEECAKYLIF